MADQHLTGKQSLFVAEYLADLNATQAAIRAGYGVPGAGTAGWRNLRNPKIKAAIAGAQAPRMSMLEIDATTVLTELAKIARANLLDYMRIDETGTPVVDFGRLDRDSAAALSEVVVEDFPRARGTDAREIRRIRFRLHDKLAALDKLAKHFGLLSERVSHEHPDDSVGEPQHDPRQVARAVIAILERATVAAEEGAGSDAG